jgi:hypothetical protein
LKVLCQYSNIESCSEVAEMMQEDCLFLLLASLGPVSEFSELNK